MGGSPVEVRRRGPSQQVFGLGIIQTERLPSPPGPVAVAPPVLHTAARQFQILTGFPDPTGLGTTGSNGPYQRGASGRRVSGTREQRGDPHALMIIVFI